MTKRMLAILATLTLVTAATAQAYHASSAERAVVTSGAGHATVGMHAAFTDLAR
jgi:hypothetical protein